MLEFLYAQCVRPELTYRHHWEVGDLLLWDNRSVQHAVIPDVGKGERILHRITIEGGIIGFGDPGCCSQHSCY